MKLSAKWSGIATGVTLLLVLLLAGCDDEQSDRAGGQTITGDEARQARGARLYARHGCAGCHGSLGHGDGPAAAGLAKRPGDFRNASTFSRGGKVEDISRTLRTGIPGTPMVGFDHLPDAERLLLARYVVFLSKQQ